MAKLFGWEISRPDNNEEKLDSFAPETNDDGAVLVAAGGAYGTGIDLEGSARTEAELVMKYRNMAMNADLDGAIEDIVNESIVFDDTTEDGTIVNINLDKLDYSDEIKAMITQEFEAVLDLLEFSQYSYDIFKKWYIDGRIYYHAIIDNEHPELGIQELRYIDPRKIRKIKEVKTKRNNKANFAMQKTAKDYYIYNDKGFNTTIASSSSVNSTTGVRIAADSIVHATSGLLDITGTIVLSFLHKAIKPLNELRALEDAAVIYRLARAPERLVFYIDTGDLPKLKAEQYLRDMMQKYKNRLVYDSESGSIRDDRKFMTMLENYWLPRRGDGKGTEIVPLPAGQNLGEMTDVLYFQKKLYRSLNVPVSRMDPETVFSLGRATEISRDEIKFSKFITRIRLRFSHLFLKALGKQLILKNIMGVEEWEAIKSKIMFNFAKDNYFDELKIAEINANRIQLLQQVEPFIGKFFSFTWVKKNVVKQTDEEIEKMRGEIEEEMKDPLYATFYQARQAEEEMPIQQAQAAEQQQEIEMQQMQLAQKQAAQKKNNK